MVFAALFERVSIVWVLKTAVTEPLCKAGCFVFLAEFFLRIFFFVHLRPSLSSSNSFSISTVCIKRSMPSIEAFFHAGFLYVPVFYVLYIAPSYVIFTGRVASECSVRASFAFKHFLTPLLNVADSLSAIINFSASVGVLFSPFT
jgi:hypothetical protein